MITPVRHGRRRGRSSPRLRRDVQKRPCGQRGRSQPAVRAGDGVSSFQRRGEHTVERIAQEARSALGHVFASREGGREGGITTLEDGRAEGQQGAGQTPLSHGASIPERRELACSRVPPGRTVGANELFWPLRITTCWKRHSTA